MPPFVAKAANAPGAELELPAKVQELLAGRQPTDIPPVAPQSSQFQLSRVRVAFASLTRCSAACSSSVSDTS